jgi:hypothetical protein
VGTSLIVVQDGSYSADNFDNLGYHRRYAVRVEGDTWTFVGEYERAKQTFDPSGRSFEIKWELSKDGKQWQPLCELHGTKL